MVRGTVTNHANMIAARTMPSLAVNNHANIVGTLLAHGTDHANTTPHRAAITMPIFQNDPFI